MKPHIVHIRTTRVVEIKANDSDHASQLVRDREDKACKKLGRKRDQSIRVFPKPSQRVIDSQAKRAKQLYDQG